MTGAKKRIQKAVPGGLKPEKHTDPADIKKPRPPLYGSGRGFLQKRRET